MKQKTLLNIPQPCSEKWENMKATETGAFCQVCKKTVVDFTHMPVIAIQRYLHSMDHPVCGRLNARQFIRPQREKLAFPSLTILRAGIIGLFVSVVGVQTYAQARLTSYSQEMFESTNARKVQRHTLVKGIVRSDEDQSALPGVNIILKNSRIGTVSDADGRFEFPQKLSSGDVLVFSFIGMETVEFVVPDQAPEVLEVTIAMKFDSTIILGEVVVGQVYTEQPGGLRKFWSKIKNLF